MLLEILMICVLFWCIQFRWQMRHVIGCAQQFKNSLRTLPIVGHAYLFFGKGPDMMKNIQKIGLEAIRQGGAIPLWLGYTLYIKVADPEIAEWAVRTCLEKEDGMRVTRSLTGEFIVIAPVPIWRQRRPLFTPAFSPRSLARYVDVFSRHASALKDRLKSAADSGPKSLLEYVAQYSMDTFFETTFGLTLRPEDQRKYTSALESLSDLFAARIMKPWLRSDAVHKMMPDYASFVKHKNTLHGLLDWILKSKREDMAATPKSRNLKNLLETLIESADEDKQLNLRGELVGLFIAGIETSAITMGFTLSMLAKHTHVQDKVLQEITQVIGDSKRITSDHLSGLKYLEAVIKETLRLYPPAPIIARKVDRDATMPDGRTLVRGCNIMINIWAINRNPLYWGEDADQFRPERFAEGPLKHPAQFMSFSFGPRNCVGYKYAMLSMKTALMMIMRHYSVNLGPRALELSFHVVARDSNKATLELVTRRF